MRRGKNRSEMLVHGRGLSSEALLSVEDSRAQLGLENVVVNQIGH